MVAFCLAGLHLFDAHDKFLVGQLLELHGESGGMGSNGEKVARPSEYKEKVFESV